MTKKDREKIRHGLETLAIRLDERWSKMHENEISDYSYMMCEELYEEAICTLKMLGGDVKRDNDGKHRVFLAGMSSQNDDDYRERAI